MTQSERLAEAVRILKEHCHPGVSPAAHALAYRVLVVLGERGAEAA